MTSNGVTTSFAYDSWGRMASKNATIGGTPYGAAYQYSYGDKLKHVWTNFPGETTTAYNYDGLGKRRVRITDYNGVNPETTWWRWDLGWTPLCEYDDPNLGWEIEGFAQFNVYNGLMHPLAEAAVSGSPANATYSYLALDHLSSTRAAYNQAKTATASLEFYPYGEPLTATGALPDARFTAKPYDPETGLYYFPYRYYSPAASRWTSRDPLGMIDGPNVYGYVLGNVVNNFDLFGLQTFTTRMCKEACDEIHKKKQGARYQACLYVCRHFNGCTCKGLESYCAHLQRGAQKRLTEQCLMLHNELCMGK